MNSQKAHQKQTNKRKTTNIRDAPGEMSRVVVAVRDHPPTPITPSPDRSFSSPSERRRRRVYPSSSSSSSSRACSKSHPHAPQKKKRLVRERGALSTASNARAESAFANMRSGSGDTIDRSRFEKNGSGLSLSRRNHARSIDRDSLRLCPHPLDARSIDGISNFHFDRVWTRFDRWK